MGADDVHVWLLDLGPAAHELAKLARLLDDAERERAGRFHFRQHRDRFTAGRGLLRSILGRYLEVPPEQVRFRYGFAGKPEIDGETSLRFNLSHSEGLGLLAVTQGRTVGADIEQIVPERDLLGLADRFFASRESVALRALPEEQRADGFYTCWTRKEAYLKAHGGGLSVGLDTFEVLPLTGPPVLTVATGPAEARRWSLCDLAPAPGFAAALAVEGRGWRVWWGRCTSV